MLKCCVLVLFRKHSLVIYNFRRSDERLNLGKDYSYSISMWKFSRRAWKIFTRKFQSTYNMWNIFNNMTTFFNVKLAIFYFYLKNLGERPFISCCHLKIIHYSYIRVGSNFILETNVIKSNKFKLMRSTEH